MNDEDPFASSPAEEEVDASAFEPDPLPVESAPEPTLDAPGPEPTPSVLPESQVLAEWNSKRQEELVLRRDKAREEKEAQRETAKEEIAKFHAERAARIKKMKAQNRDEEQNFAAEMSNTMEFGSQWEKV